MEVDKLYVGKVTRNDETDQIWWENHSQFYKRKGDALRWIKKQQPYYDTGVLYEYDLVLSSTTSFRRTDNA